MAIRLKETLSSVTNIHLVQIPIEEDDIDDCSRREQNLW